jgi:hypothetical protein
MSINTIAIICLVVASPFLLFVLVGNIVHIIDMNKRIKRMRHMSGMDKESRQ